MCNSVKRNEGRLNEKHENSQNTQLARQPRLLADAEVYVLNERNTTFLPT